ncbi:outer membrane beta-barrel protein [Maribacter chungangensis]|uniref:Outer membrane beta-barrel protein n=1 Tax=Maribacter chungangensis TaxID=1069117 RepID=A0ABW3B939_9FLAO
MKSAFFLFSFFYFFALNAQDFTIQGTVYDADEKPLVFANVLLRTMDSTLVKGATTDANGSFKLTNVTTGDYLLLASYIENTSETLNISVTDNLDVGPLIISNDAQALDEVVVVSQKPRLVELADRYVFNIETTALSDSDIWDVLKRTPGIVIVNDKLTVNNVGNIGILINGRKVNIPEKDIINLLSGSSASKVEAIEVITNPPVKYSAEGGLLIDIKMKSNLVAGYNGSVYNRYTQGVFAKHTLGTDHFFKGNKTDFSLAYSLQKNKDLVRYTDVTNFFENGTPNSVWTAEQNTITKRQEHNISAFFDYHLNERNTISLSTINSLAPKVNRFSFSETEINSDQTNTITGFDTENDSDFDLYNASVYLDWVHKFKQKGKQISFNTHYTYYEYDRAQDIETDFFDANQNVTGANDFITKTLQNTGLFSIQTDFTTNLGNNTKLETGLRYAKISSDNTIDQQGFDRSQPGIDPTETGEFVYNEAISAGYLSLNNNWDNLKLNMGLRAEYTETESKLDTDTEININDYLEFFPSLSLLYTHKKKHEFKFNYYRRITRPRYGWLNPFQFFQNNNTVVEGNPNLLPSFSDFVSLGYIFNKNLTIRPFYNRRNNDFLQQVNQDNEGNLLRFIATNLEETISYGVDTNFNKAMTNRWSSYIMFNYYFTENNFRDLDSGQLLRNTAWITQFRTTQSYTFLEDRSLYADIVLSYFSPLVIGNSRRDGISEFGFFVRKSFWDKNASVSLTVDDLFNQGNPFFSRQYLTQDNTSSIRRENRLVVLGFRYAFGNTKIRNNKKRKRVEERNRI